MIQRGVVVRPAWITAESVRPRDTLWLPGGAADNAWAVDTVRALLAREDIDAWSEFCGISEAIRPAIAQFTQWAKARPKKAANVLNQLQRSGADAATLFRMSRIAFPAVDGEAFAKRWLRGSKLGASIVVGLASFDAVEVDLIALDHERIEASEPLAEMYGPQTRKQNRMRKDAHAAGLSPHSSLSRWYTCFDWVECEHVYGGLTKWLLAHGKDYEQKGTESRRFAPLEKALMIRKETTRL